MNLINNLQSGHCFESSRTRHNTNGKITTFKLGYPVSDGGICLNWATQFLMVAYDVSCSPNVSVRMA